MVDRSYDPKYNAVYITRFFTGLVGGPILATALGPMLAHSRLDKGEFSFTPGVLAILGGDAAEVVQQILQRLVEVLLTVVRGDGSAEANSKSAAARIEVSAVATTKLLEFERESNPEKKTSRLADLFSILKPGQT